jgi:hypothetical protein
MALSELFVTYANRNAELRSVCKTLFEYGKTIAKEASSAYSQGLTDHAIKRQRDYLAYATGLVNAIASKPEPDQPATHPIRLDINFEEPYVTFTTSVNGEEVPINESTQLLAEYWLITAVELAKSQSAAHAGGLHPKDHERAINNLTVIEKLLNEMTERPLLDLPETSVPGSNYQAPTGSTIVKKA